MKTVSDLNLSVHTKQKQTMKYQHELTYPQADTLQPFGLETDKVQLA